MYIKRIITTLLSITCLSALGKSIPEIKTSISFGETQILGEVITGARLKGYHHDNPDEYFLKNKSQSKYFLEMNDLKRRVENLPVQLPDFLENELQELKEQGVSTIYIDFYASMTNEFKHGWEYRTDPWERMTQGCDVSITAIYSYPKNIQEELVRNISRSRGELEAATLDFAQKEHRLSMDLEEEKSFNESLEHALSSQHICHNFLKKTHRLYYTNHLERLLRDLAEGIEKRKESFNDYLKDNNFTD